MPNLSLPSTLQVRPSREQQWLLGWLGTLVNYGIAHGNPRPSNMRLETKKKRGGCVGRFPEPWMISYTAWCTAQHVTSGVQLPKELQPFPFCPMQRTWKLTKWNWATENRNKVGCFGVGWVLMFLLLLLGFFVSFVFGTVTQWKPLLDKVLLRTASISHHAYKI